MKVTRVIPRLIQREMPGTVWNPRRRWQEKTIVLAFVETDTGLVGVGEAWASAGSPRALIATIEDDLAPLILGEDPFHTTRLNRLAAELAELSGRSGIIAAALSALDIALWDLIGKATGMPLFELLGANEQRVTCYASGGLYGEGKTADALAAEVRGYVEQGFAAVKIKVGGVPLKEDLARVSAVRAAIGPDIRLMVDAHNDLSVPDALKMARALESFDIHFLEAPTALSDVAGQARINRDGPIPVAGNESEAWAHRFRDLLLADAVHFVQFDVSACGGIGEGRRIAALARAFGRPCTLHAASTSVLFAASLHLAAACANCASVEYHMVHPWLWDFEPPGTFDVTDGCVRPPRGPGLGLALTPDTIHE